MTMPTVTRIIVIICLICFLVTLGYAYAVQNAPAVCGCWCSGWGRPIPGVDEWYRCIVSCTEVLR